MQKANLCSAIGGKHFRFILTGACWLWCCWVFQRLSVAAGFRDFESLAERFRRSAGDDRFVFSGKGTLQPEMGMVAGDRPG